MIRISNIYERIGGYEIGETWYSYKKEAGRMTFDFYPEDPLDEGVFQIKGKNICIKNLIGVYHD